jgi:FkbM family methyltransferase
VGAAKGYWSEFTAYFFPDATFYMIDPLPESQPSLQRLSDLRPAFHPLFCAVGDVAGELPIHVADNLDGSSLLSFGPEHNTPTRLVPVHRIDDLLADGKIAPPQLVKLDVQGYELKVLAGGQRLFDTAEVFILETSLYEFSAGIPLVHEVIDYMQQRQFLLYDIAGHLRRPYQNDLGQMDLVFVRQNVGLRASNQWNP